MASSFVYVTFIRTTPDQLWTALTEREFVEKYWFGAHLVSDWKTGSPWKIIMKDGRVADTGELLEVDPPRRMVIKWRNEFMPELKAEGYSRCVMEIEQMGEACKLTISHSIEKDHSKFVEAVSGGWPRILSNLKSLLETGSVVMTSRPG